ncbi:MAG TPA: hypothetical protein VKU94_05020 [Geobacterales bacterium]|nr:hypothetical protein [Geobacterales bacterium]
MYSIVGREILGKRRFGKFLVEFSCEWPRSAVFGFIEEQLMRLLK